MKWKPCQFISACICFSLHQQSWIWMQLHSLLGGRLTASNKHLTWACIAGPFAPTHDYVYELSGWGTHQACAASQQPEQVIALPALHELQARADERHSPSPLHPLPPSLLRYLCSHHEWTSKSTRLFLSSKAWFTNGSYEQQAPDQYLTPYNFKVQYSVSSEQRTIYAASLLLTNCAMPGSTTPSYLCRPPGRGGTPRN